MTAFEVLLSSLQREGVSFVIVGGVAATLHGSARLTNDLDIVYERSNQNIANLVRALQPLNPYLRGAPAGLPFVLNAETMRRGLNFTLRTDAGDIDLLGEINGIGSFPSALAQSLEVSLFGATYRFLDLEALITSKRAAGRPKDFEVIAELETIREERKS